MIREFQKSDAESWCKIREENLLKINSYNYPQEVINFLICTSNAKSLIIENVMLVYEKKGEILGTISLNSDGEIKNLFVKPSHHRKRIGKELVKEIEKNQEKIFVYASAGSVEFYEKQGYTKEHEEIDEINGKGFKVVFMTKQI